jgi:hypothetical protein
MRGVREQAATSIVIKEEGNIARYLGYDLVISHSVGGVFRRIRAQKDAYQVVSVPFFCTFPDNLARKAFRKVQKRAEPTVLARREVADIMEQWLWDITPQRLEN